MAKKKCTKDTTNKSHTLRKIQGSSSAMSNLDIFIVQLMHDIFLCKRRNPN